MRTRILACIQQSSRWERNQSWSIDRVSDLKGRNVAVEVIPDGWSCLACWTLKIHKERQKTEHQYDESEEDQSPF